MSKSPKVLGSICLYGSSEYGAGYLASVGEDLPSMKIIGGDGDPPEGRSMNSAYFMGMDDLLEHYGPDVVGVVEVFAAGGEKSAKVRIDNSWPYFGDLAWGAAPVYTIAMEDVLAAAEPA